MISISDESNTKISKFQKNTPIKLLVASDINGANINLHNVTSRPYAVLMDYEGKILWSGKPGDLNYKSISKSISIWSSGSTLSSQENYQNNEKPHISQKIYIIAKERNYMQNGVWWSRRSNLKTRMEVDVERMHLKKV